MSRCLKFLTVKYDPRCNTTVFATPKLGRRFLFSFLFRQEATFTRFARKYVARESRTLYGIFGGIYVDLMEMFHHLLTRRKM